MCHKPPLPTSSPQPKGIHAHRMQKPVLVSWKHTSQLVYILQTLTHNSELRSPGEIFKIKSS